MLLDTNLRQDGSKKHTQCFTIAPQAKILLHHPAFGVTSVIWDHFVQLNGFQQRGDFSKEGTPRCPFDCRYEFFSETILRKGPPRRISRLHCISETLRYSAEVAGDHGQGHKPPSDGFRACCDLPRGLSNREAILIRAPRVPGSHLEAKAAQQIRETV